MSEKNKKICDLKTITTYIDKFFLLSLDNPNYDYHRIRISIDLYTLKAHTLIDTLKLKLLKALTDHFYLDLILYDNPQYIIIHT